MTVEFLRVAATQIESASRQEQSLRSLGDEIAKLFPNLKVPVSDTALQLRFESSLLEVKVVDQGRFRTFRNNKQPVTAIADFGDGAVRDSNGLAIELVEFSGAKVT